MTSTPFPDLDLTQWLAERIREEKAQAWEEGYYEAELQWRHVYEGHVVDRDDPNSMCATCGQGNPYKKIT